MPTRSRPGAVLHVVRMTVPLASADALEATLAQQGITMVLTEHFDRQAAVFEAYFDQRSAAAAQCRRLRDVVGPARAAAVTLRRLPRRDWSESWKSHFRVQRVSPRLVVRPSWAVYRPKRGDHVIELDPGMSFGTGRHATTRACLRFLDRLARRQPGASFLDVGCGSGILAIAAAKLGCHPVVAFDNDVDAVRIARANGRRNGVARQIRVSSGDITRPPRLPRFDVVAANLLASLIRDNAAALAARVKPGGHLVLAGILSTEYPSIRVLCRQLGFREMARATGNEWTSGLFRHRPAYADRRPPVAKQVPAPSPSGGA